MKYTYHTKGTCSSQIELELDGNVVHNVKFVGGCDGNLKAIPQLVEGLPSRIRTERLKKYVGTMMCRHIFYVNIFFFILRKALALSVVIQAQLSAVCKQPDSDQENRCKQEVNSIIFHAGLRSGCIIPVSRIS